MMRRKGATTSLAVCVLAVCAFASPAWKAGGGPGRPAEISAGGRAPAGVGTPPADAGAPGAAAQTWERERPLRQGFEVDVLVSGRPLEELYARGRRYVEASEGAEYELRVRNPLPERVAVALSVDGLNTIDARRASGWDSSKWVIEPYQTIRITGWQMSSERARRFYFTTERDSYATKLGRTADQGVISAVFYRAVRPVAVTPPPFYREGDDPRPLSERRSAPKESAKGAGNADGAARSSGTIGVAPRPDDEYAATGIGRSVGNRVVRVQLELERRPAAEVSIRYEYRDALVKLGVLPRARPYEDPLRRRERARGFEDPRFCPEP